MPLVHITIVKGRDAAAKQALMDAVHGALMEAFGIPENDQQQRISELRREDFKIPPHCSDDFILLDITVFAGRSVDAKRALYRAVVRNLEERCGVAPTDVFITLDERPLENWGLRGGTAGCDIDFGFKIDV